MSIIIKVTNGTMAEQEFRFEQPDVFLFGRASHCHCCLSNDPFVSRDHFIMEVTPPLCRIKDLGSLNGTYINGVKYGGRSENDPPNPDRARGMALAVDIRHGDSINVGDTVLRMSVVDHQARGLPATCVQCDCVIPEEIRDQLAFIGGTWLCRECRRQNVPQPQPAIGHPIGKCESLGELLATIQQEVASPIPTIPGYDFIRELGEGGYGRVYQVKRHRDNREVALKTMLSDGSGMREKDVQLFQREMANCMELRHPHIVSFEEQGYADGVFYFIMEFCAGGSITDLMSMRGGRLQPDEAFPFMFQILDGLAFIHEYGFVHRDLKPENILLDSSLKIAKIADLGLSKNFEQAGLSCLTATGVFGGSPWVIPREQITNFRHVTPVSDIFSVGATFYNMLTGEPVYDFRRGVDPIRTILDGKLISIKKRGVKIPGSVARVIDKSISVKPEDRYPTAVEMYDALKNAIG